MSNADKEIEWAWIYGDECDFLWDHFGLPDRDSEDRIKIKFLEYETAEEQKIHPFSKLLLAKNRGVG